MKLDTKPASDYPTPDLLQLLNLGFENYLVPIHFELSQFLTMLRKDTIDLTASRVLLVDDKPSGIALIARRGWTSRLAAMGIARNMRGKKAGSWFMEKLIHESRKRNDREMVLEVIEQNEPVWSSQSLLTGLEVCGATLTRITQLGRISRKALKIRVFRSFRDVRVKDFPTLRKP